MTADAIARPQVLERLLRDIGDLADILLHAAADIEQQKYR